MEAKQIKFYLNSDEYEKAKENANEVNLTINQYAKRLAIDVTSIASREDREVLDTLSDYIIELQKTKAELRKIGSNVNQIARAKNLELYYKTTSHDTASFRRASDSDLEMELFVRSGEEAKAFNRIADELSNIRSSLKKFQVKEEQEESE